MVQGIRQVTGRAIYAICIAATANGLLISYLPGKVKQGEQEASGQADREATARQQQGQ